MSELKCAIMPSGSTSFHVWKQGAMTGDLCQCGERRLEACQSVTGPSGKYDGTTMREVLEWASDHVLDARSNDILWDVLTRGTNFRSFVAPTLYDALYEAWKAREKGGE